MRMMWTQNGDKLSNQYAGTDTNNSGTLQGEGHSVSQTFGKYLTGLKRFINNKFSDE